MRDATGISQKVEEAAGINVEYHSRSFESKDLTTGHDLQISWRPERRDASDQSSMMSGCLRDIIWRSETKAETSVTKRLPGTTNLGMHDWRHSAG